MAQCNIPTASCQSSCYWPLHNVSKKRIDDSAVPGEMVDMKMSNNFELKRNLNWTDFERICTYLNLWPLGYLIVIIKGHYQSMQVKGDFSKTIGPFCIMNQIFLGGQVM